MSALKCLPCVAEHKIHAQTIGADGQPPEILDAVTIAGTEFGPVTPICYTHLTVTRHSVLTQGLQAIPAAAQHG